MASLYEVYGNDQQPMTPSLQHIYGTVDDKNAGATAKLQDISGDPNVIWDEASVEQSWGGVMKDVALTSASAIINGLDYLGNISRTMMNAKATGKDWWEQGKEAAENRRFTSSAELRESFNKVAPSFVTRKHGVDNDDKVEWGDVGDIVTDIALDAVTDPLSWLSFGMSGIAKSAAKTAVKKATREGGEAYIKQIAKRANQPVSTMEEAIKVGDQLDIMGKYNRQKMAQAALAKGGAAAQTVKQFGEPIIGGAIASQMDSEFDDTAIDKTMKFMGGAAASVAGRQVYNRFIKANAYKIGERMNQFVTSKKPVMAQTIDANGTLRNIETEMTMARAGEITTEAGQKAMTANALIEQPLKTAINRMRKEDPIGAAVTMRAINDFRDYNIFKRNERWDDQLKQLTEAELKDLKLKPDTKFEAAPVEAKSLIDKVTRESARDVVDTKGNIKPALLGEWATKQGLESTDRIQNNLLEWQKATKESWEVEKQFIYENWTDKDFLDEILPTRTKALVDQKVKLKERMKVLADRIKSGGDAVQKADDEIAMSVYQKQLSELNKVKLKGAQDVDEVRGMLELRMKNPGLAVWSPKTMENSLAASKLVAKGEPKVLTSDAKRAYATAEETKRDWIGRKNQDVDIKDIVDEDAKAIIEDFEASVAIQARKKARNSLNIGQKEAAQSFGEFLANKSSFEKGIRKLNALAKQGMLLGKYTWLTNNYWSNMRQAFVKGGLMEALDTTSIIPFKNEIKKDLSRLFLHRQKKAPAFEFASEETEDMIRLGIIDAPVFNDARQLQEDYGKFLYDEDTLTKIKGDEGQLDRIKKGFDFWTEKVLHTRQLGTYAEAYARASTYMNTLKMLNKNYLGDLTEAFGEDVAKESLKKQATQITNDTFFDYGKLKYWERSYARELIPFYSFYKQNLFYQMKSLADPTKVNRLATLKRLGDGRYFGSEPMSEETRTSLPDWLSANNAGIYKDAKGREKLFYSTSDPAMAAFQMVSKDFIAKGEFMQQVNPIITTMLGQAMNYDFFRKQTFSPEEISNDPKRQVKHLFSRGYFWENVMAPFFDDKDNPVWLDKNGNPVTDSELLVRIDNIMSLAAAVADLPIQVASQWGKTSHGKQSVGEMINNMFGPVKTTDVKEDMKSRKIRDFWDKKAMEKDPDFYRQLRRTNQFTDPTQ